MVVGAIVEHEWGFEAVLLINDVAVEVVGGRSGRRDGVLVHGIVLHWDYRDNGHDDKHKDEYYERDDEGFAQGEFVSSDDGSGTPDVR